MFIGDVDMKKKKKIFIACSVLVLLAVAVPLAIVVHDNMKERERLSQPAYFTEYKLTEEEYRHMQTQFHAKTEPNYKKEEDLSLWPDYSHYKVTATEDTEIVVAVLNEHLFVQRLLSWEEATIKAEKYGFSAENPITVEWVMTHQKEAMDIMHSTPDRGSYYSSFDRVMRSYEKIMKKSESVTE